MIHGFMKSFQLKIIYLKTYKHSQWNGFFSELMDIIDIKLISKSVELVYFWSLLLEIVVQFPRVVFALGQNHWKMLQVAPQLVTPVVTCDVRLHCKLLHVVTSCTATFTSCDNLQCMQLECIGSRSKLLKVVLYPVTNCDKY